MEDSFRGNVIDFRRTKKKNATVPGHGDGDVCGDIKENLLKTERNIMDMHRHTLRLEATNSMLVYFLSALCAVAAVGAYSVGYRTGLQGGLVCAASEIEIEIDPKSH